MTNTKKTAPVENLVESLYNLCDRLYLEGKNNHGYPLMSTLDAVSAAHVAISTLEQSGFTDVTLAYALEIIPGTRYDWYFDVIEDAILECY